MIARRSTATRRLDEEGPPQLGPAAPAAGRRDRLQPLLLVEARARPPSSSRRTTRRACSRPPGRCPPAPPLEAVEQYYRACLNSRGYVRDKQIDPPPPGSYRGIENGEEFNAAAQAVDGPGAAAGLRAAARPARRPEGARPDHGGRVRHDAQAPGGRRDAGALTPAPAPPRRRPRSRRRRPAQLAGRWYGRDGSDSRHPRATGGSSTGTGSS